MRHLFERIAHHARVRPEQVALTDTVSSLTYRELHGIINHLSGRLRGSRVALLVDNSCAWALLDLALQRRGATCIPIPPFFSDAQVMHLIGDAEPDLIVTDQPQRLEQLVHISPAAQWVVANRWISLFPLPLVPLCPLPPDTAKITYTSGTTGQPRGVCLAGGAIAEVAITLGAAVGATAADRTLSVLPLSTLLENIGGVYAPLYHGATAALPELAECGLSGSSRVRPERFIAALHRFVPTSLILVPQLLKLLVEAVAAGATVPAALRFIAVGGAPCPAGLIERARGCGLPVYQGYGLSEAVSVVCLARPGDSRGAGVGRPLPHVRVRIAADGEIVVGGRLFSGYLGAAASDTGEWATGDLGHFDAAGYLHVTGRKKTAYATAYGRKVAPEWVEGELTAHRSLLQAAVFGEGRPYNVAVIAPQPAATTAQVDSAIAAANSRLPDYARVAAWCRADEPFSAGNGLARAAGTLDRAAIARRYADQLDELYAGEQQYVVI